MARYPSKIMTIAEKTVALTGLKTQLKTHNASVKAIDVDRAAANKVFADAKKAADKAVTDVAKTTTAALKAVQATLKAAEKVHATAIAKLDKQAAAAAKGTEKLNGQISTLSDTPAAVTEKLPKVKLANVQSLTATTTTAGSA